MNTTLANIQHTDFNLSDNPEIAKHQAETIQHALSVSSRIVTDPVYNSTQQLKIRTDVQSKFIEEFGKIFGIFSIVFGFVFLVSSSVKMQVPQLIPRTVETGDLETTNKILQRELMLTKSELDTKIREVEMLQREFKELREKE